METDRKIAKLTLIFPGPEEEINIFIHGYSAVTSQSKFERLAYYILSARPPGRVYLLYWRSGNWRLPAWTQSLITLSRTAYRIFRVGEIFSPGFLLADAAVFTAGEMISYRYYERRAENLGNHLKHYIRGIPGAGDEKINLIGHSLGARVIHYALFRHEWSDYYINDVLFLGGAADAETDNWDICLSRIQGNIYNLYSKRDLVLKVTPDMRKRVGRTPIPFKSPRIINRRYKFQHTDYWPNLESILTRVWRDFRPTPYVCLRKQS